MNTKPEEPTAEESRKEITIDDALRETGFGKFNWGVIILCGMTISSVFMESVSINIILPLAQCDLELTSVDKGWLSGITKVGVLTSSYFWGYLADTQGRKAVMAVPMLIAAFFSVLSSFSTSFGMLMILRLLNGIL
jgi:MFS transporter, VNT family, synaptic vesicle glycoprotein 2